MDSRLEAFAIIFMLNLKFEKSWSNLKNLRVFYNRNLRVPRILSFSVCEDESKISSINSLKLSGWKLQVI
jgi:hypothetical protein